MADDFKVKEIALNGKLITSSEAATIGDNFSTLSNMRYTDVGIKAVAGMSRINTTALSTYPKVRSGFHYRKEQPSESHVLVQAYNTGLTASQVLQNTTAIASQGDFIATALHTDSPGAGRGRFSESSKGVAYCNGVESMIWGGDEAECNAYANIDPNNSFYYDYTGRVTNTETTAAQTASFSPAAAGLDSNTMLLLSLNNNVTDTSPTTAHTVANTSVTFDPTNKVFGSHAGSFNGSTAYLSVPDNSDFDFSSGAFTVDLRARVTSLADTNPIYYHWTALSKLDFTSGSREPLSGETVTGALSGATSLIHEVVVDSGDWGSGDAAGSMYIASQTGTYQTEQIDIGAETNVCQVAGDSVSHGEDYVKLAINTDGSVEFIIYHSYGAGVTELSLTTAASTISINTWYHIEVVESSNDWYLFVDGSLKAYTSDTARLEDQIQDVYIGYDNTDYFVGQIDELRVSNTARHTEEFQIPLEAYSDEANTVYYYVGSVRPLQGFKEYIGTANTATSTKTVQYWDGAKWTSVSSLSDGTSSGVISLAQTGSTTFDSTETVAKTRPINEVVLYWYRVSISAVDTAATVYYVTLDAPFQTIKDLWDGTERATLSFQKYSSSTYNDNTLEVFEEDFSSANSATYADISSLGASDYCVAGFSERMMGVYITFVTDNTNSTAGVLVTVSYWDGDDWVSVGTVNDGTLEDSRSFNKSGVVSWNPPDEALEFKTEIGSELQLYYYKFSFNLSLSATVYLDKLTGIPAQKTIKGYKFPLFAQNRLWLCSEEKGRKNVALVSAYQADSNFNGSDHEEFEFGGEDELTAGASLYSQFGSNLYNVTILTKKNETWIVVGSGPESWVQYRASAVIGCVAPLTMQLVHLDNEEATDFNKQVAIWQGSSGVYMFDGRVLRRISNDIKDVFDRSSASAINLSKIGDSVGFFDSMNQEYHWLYASGTSTTLDKELVYDLYRDKWFDISRSAALQFGLAVHDTSGNVYTYGFVDTGYMQYLENGTTFDGSGITGTFQFGDIAIENGSIAVETIVRKIKLFGVAKTVTSGSITGTHYGDTSSTGTTYTMAPQQTGKRVFFDTKSKKLGPHTFHSFKFSMTTDDETIGFEPLFLAVGYKPVRYGWSIGG